MSTTIIGCLVKAGVEAIVTDGGQLVFFQIGAGVDL